MSVVARRAGPQTWAPALLVWPDDLTARVRCINVLSYVNGVSQVWVEMVAASDPASTLAGQLSGCVSEEQAWFPGPLPNISNPATAMPRLAGEACLLTAAWVYCGHSR